ncbi:hypothetical protein RJT34_24619 [Clitoria ternatea]|uniref:Uncharacterized protein n=1 Tax=Clitoria ternatea TaxID=43366 RepID=A0AAN9ILA2_CLITE
MGSATMGGSKRRLSSRGFGGVLREQRAKLYIIRRCVVMLLLTDSLNASYPDLHLFCQIYGGVFTLQVSRSAPLQYSRSTKHMLVQ